MRISKISALVFGSCVLALAACGPSTSTYPEPSPTSDQSIPNPKPGEAEPKGGGLFGREGITLAGDDTRANSAATGGAAGGVGVNAFLWRATLDTISFMPLAKADPFGGVVLTDWYSPAQSPSERMKVSVYILDTKLRADALKVSIFRQTKQPTGNWEEAAVSPDTQIRIENAILNRARELRAGEQ
ncbi:MAG TPA: DUF3576 domain-containing protein [Alphaproteobacteria bacterium]|nr:DUF3576 domain-containing protein [Alphaproteobacteria bacterium]